MFVYVLQGNKVFLLSPFLSDLEADYDAENVFPENHSYNRNSPKQDIRQSSKTFDFRGSRLVMDLNVLHFKDYRDVR